jgi:leucyl-tRNA synthetase
VDEAAAAEEEITLVLQINGKVRDRLQVPVDITEDQARTFALTSPTISKYLEGREPKKVILVPGKLVNIVI